MPRQLPLIVDTLNGRHERVFSVARAYNLGFTIRDAAKMQAHLDEVAKEGVPAPSVDAPPIVFPISTWAITTDTDVSAQYAKSSGEVEIVTLVDSDGALFVTVGSDHTDRELESIDIPWSKQVCANVLAPIVWPWDEVSRHWDQCLLESDVTTRDGTVVPYQRARVGEFWSPPEMIGGLARKVRPAPGGKLVWSGTVVSLDHTLDYGPRWTIRLIDPALNRVIEHTYDVVVLIDEIDTRDMRFARRGSGSTP